MSLIRKGSNSNSVKIGDIFQILRDNIDSAISVDKKKYPTEHFKFSDLYDFVDSLEEAYNEASTRTVNNSLFRNIDKSIENISDLLHVKQSTAPHLAYSCSLVLSFLNVLLTETSRVRNVEYIKANFKYLNRLLDNYELTLNNISKAAYEESTSDADRLIHFLDVYSIKLKENGFLLICDGNIGKHYKLYLDSSSKRKSTLPFKIVKQQYFIDITFTIDNADTTKSYYALWLIHKALSSIKKVDVQVLDIKIGSLIERLFLWADDLVAKEETKEVLTNALLKKKQNNTAKSDKKTITAKRKKEIDEIKITDMTIKELKKVKLISELLKHAILECDEIKIDLNGIQVFLKKDGHISKANVDIDEVVQ